MASDSSFNSLVLAVSDTKAISVMPGATSGVVSIN